MGGRPTGAGLKAQQCANWAAPRSHGHSCSEVTSRPQPPLLSGLSHQEWEAARTSGTSDSVSPVTHGQPGVAAERGEECGRGVTVFCGRRKGSERGPPRPGREQRARGHPGQGPMPGLFLSRCHVSLTRLLASLGLSFPLCTKGPPPPAPALPALTEFLSSNVKHSSTPGTSLVMTNGDVPTTRPVPEVPPLPTLAASARQ